MPSNLNSRLAKLEAQLAALATQQQATNYLELLEAGKARAKNMTDEEVLRPYNAMWTAPITDPALAAEMAALEGLSAEQLIQLYMQKIKGEK